MELHLPKHLQAYSGGLEKGCSSDDREYTKL
jgi:hypothetical protein